MVINKPEIYIKGLKYSLIPIGYLMNIIGKLTTNQRVELLGHYLSCSGNKYTLNSKILNEALDKGNIQITPLPMIKYGFIIKPGHLEDNYILGKFFLIVVAIII